MGEIVIYTTTRNAEIQVDLDGETVWLSLQQMAFLFDRDKSVISKHLSAIFKSGELLRNSVVAKNATTANDGKIYQVDFYNLDAILSVGYRVNSLQGTRFRQWATQRLKDYIVQGFTVNKRRLEQLEQVVSLVRQSANTRGLPEKESKGLFDILATYTQSFILLNQFDSNRLAEDGLNENITYEIQYPDAMVAIGKLKAELVKRKEASELFGNQKDQSFAGILGGIVQTFAGEYVYPSIEAQAAHLLYFVIKNHPFSDGNKRIGAFLFVWFLELNKHQFKSSGELKLNDNALVALALLVAQSHPDDKEIMIRLIVNLINN